MLSRLLSKQACNIQKHALFKKCTLRTFSTTKHIEATSFLPSQLPTILSENSISVFSVSYCPHCTQTKDVLKNLGH